MSENDQARRAYALGATRAAHEVNDHNQKVPVDDVWAVKDQQDFLTAVTGDKLDPDSEFAQALIENYENGYYDAEEWEFEPTDPPTNKENA